VYSDPDNLLKIDKRDLWWEKYGKLRGNGYEGLPSELKQATLNDITAQPLLNYLLALSYERKRIKFTDKTNLNALYEDLIDAVYDRAWQSPFRPLQGIDIDDFKKVLEEIAVSTWQGAGRTTTLKAIEKRCEQNNLTKILIKIKTKAKDGIIALLTVFYFHNAGRQGADQTFEFTHKSFGEYLAARKIIRQIMTTKIATENNKTSQTGWTNEAALEKWIDICSKEPIDGYIFNFLYDEIRRHDKEDVKSWQNVLCELISYMLRNGMPFDKRLHLTFLEKTRYSRNSEESLLAVLSACARYTNEISKIDWLAETSAGEWLSKLCGQQMGYAAAKNYLNHLDLSDRILCMRDLYGANLSHSCLKGCNLRYSILAYANLSGTDLSGADMWEANLRGADLREANLGTKGSPFWMARLEEVKSDDAKVYAVRGFNNQVDNNHLGAIKDYTKAIELEPSNAQHYDSRGISYGWLNEHEKAIADHTKATELAPNNAEYFLSLARELCDLNDFDNAYANLNNAMCLDDKLPRCYAIRGFIGLKRAKHDKGECKPEVLGDLNKAIELDANDALSYMCRAEYYLYSNNLGDAYADLEKALAIDDRHGRVYFLMAQYYEMQGDRQEYERYMSKSKELRFVPCASDY